MIVWIWVRDDESGLADDEFKDGDPNQVKDDSFEPSIGTQEKKSWLIVKIPDPPNLTKWLGTGPDDGELIRKVYTTGQDPNVPVMRHKRVYRLDWRSKFTQSEIAIIEDGADVLPDGPTSSGGTVTSGVVSGLFTLQDFVRK